MKKVALQRKVEKSQKGHRNSMNTIGKNVSIARFASLIRKADFRSYHLGGC